MTELKGQTIKVPYGKTVHGSEEEAAVLSVLRSSTQMGEHVRTFEDKIATLFEKQYGIMVNSGSSANYLAVEILDLPKGSEVITPVLTFATTVAPILKNNLIPIFIDVEPDTYNIDVGQIEKNISETTRALMIPSLLGNFSDWSKIRKIADKHGLIVIEDSADTLGARISGISTGRYSDISTTSFYGSHVINCAGNGGMLCVRDKKLARRATLLRSWGRSSSLFVDSESSENRFNVELSGIDYDAKFLFEAVGYNFEPSEMGAAFGLVQLKKLEANISARQKYFDAHLKFFSACSEFFLLPKTIKNAHTGWLAFPLIVRDNAPFSRKELQIFLESYGIQTRVVFTGNILKQPGFSAIKNRSTEQSFVNADQVMRGGMLLGCHHGMTDEMLEYVHTKVADFIKSKT